jgi:hypothetical protein
VLITAMAAARPGSPLDICCLGAISITAVMESNLVTCRNALSCDLVARLQQHGATMSGVETFNVTRVSQDGVDKGCVYFGIHRLVPHDG